MRKLIYILFLVGCTKDIKPKQDPIDCDFGLPPRAEAGNTYLRPPGQGENPVSGLVAISTPNYSVRLTWNRYGKKVFRYKVYRSQVQGFVPDQSTNIATTFTELYNDGPLQPATTYYYRVTHVDNRGAESAPSNEVSVTTQPPSTLQKVILIDFDGHTVTGSNPWVSYNGGNPLVLSPSQTSANQKQEILNYFLEKMDTFDVVITTSEAVFQSGNPFKRQRIVYTPSHSWYNSQAGGVAFNSTFIQGVDVPAFVFESALYMNTTYIKRAGVHEMGHTLSLNHHVWYKSENPLSPDYCVLLGSYHPGDTFARMMGNPYNFLTALFIPGRTGETCPFVQDDIKDMGEILGYD